LDRVKESVFSALLPYLQEAVVLDLFSGSGSLGIEALSRGSARCDFVDSSRRSVQATKDNLKATRLSDNASVHFSDWKSYLISCNTKYDLVFLDPPYTKGIEDEVMKILAKNLDDNGVVVLETEIVPDSFLGFEVIRQAKYGRVYVTFYKKIL
ncbi:MAG: RsmD family RNA methyltransferase, partial [Clostridia bacterium]|nr:RsmD family RNA methyltransferase [Clostridia bacterium]